jgi:hypothetical protein
MEFIPFSRNSQDDALTDITAYLGSFGGWGALSWIRDK